MRMSNKKQVIDLTLTDEEAISSCCPLTVFDKEMLLRMIALGQTNEDIYQQFSRLHVACLDYYVQQMRAQYQQLLKKYYNRG